MIQLKWQGDPPDCVLEIEHLVRQDLIDINEDLGGRCSQLIFHHVFIGDDMEGPLVFVWGEEGDDDNYHCEYVADPKWESINKEVE